MTRENGTQNRGLLAGFSPLAGVSAGTAAVLFAFGVLCLAWHQVSGHVSLAITVLAYVVMAALRRGGCRRGGVAGRAVGGAPSP